MKQLLLRSFLTAIFALQVGPLCWAQNSPSPADIAQFNNGGAAYQKGDYATARRLLMPLAEKGMADAQYNIGMMYLEGYGVKVDHKVAAGWFLKAAEQGIADAQTSLGTLYATGQGVPHDDATANIWFKKAADQGDAIGQWRLGMGYYYGYGVAQSYPEAAKLYLKAAEQGVKEAQEFIGVMFANGEGVDKDPEKAVHWYKKAAEQGMASSYMKLAYMMLSGDVPQDPVEAEKWLVLAAKQNVPQAQEALNQLRKVLRDAPRGTFAETRAAQPGSSATNDSKVRAADRAGVPMNASETPPSPAPVFRHGDLAKIASTYSQNEMRFKRDFLGQAFRDVMPFRAATEDMFSKGTYSVSFGVGDILGELSCTVSSPDDVSFIADWNKGDQIKVAGVVKNVTFGRVYLSPCALTK